MAMSYTSLVADKSAVGSIASWVNYALLQPTVIVDEAQSLLYSLLRTREMQTELNFAMQVGGASFTLPSRFLDPIGRIRLTSINSASRHKDASFIKDTRNYDETSGALGTDPFTTVLGSPLVTVALAGNGFSQDSSFNTSGATAVGGVTINGTFPITAIASDGNSFTIDISVLDVLPTSGATGGGSAVAYICDSLVQGIPVWFGILGNQLQFDVAFSQASLGKLQYYQSLPLLSSSNETNFLTNRYPQLMRTACVTAAADFMKDDNEYQKGMQRLATLVERTSVDNDGMLRGLELDTMTP